MSSISSSLVPSFIKRRYAAKFVVSILFVLIAIGLVGGVGYVDVNETLEQDVEDELHSMSVMQADSLDEWTSKMSSQAHLLSERQEIQQGDTPQIEAQFAYERPARLDDAASLYVVEIDSGEVIASSTEGDRNPEGTHIDDIDDPWANESVFQEAHGDNVWMSPGTYRSSGNPDRAVVAFVTQAGNDRVVVFEGSIDVRIGQLHQGGESQFTEIIDTNGEYVLRAEDDELDATEGGAIDDDRQLEAIQSAAADREVQFTRHDGMLRAYTPVGAGDRTGDWVAVTNVPASDAFEVRDTAGLSVLSIIATGFLTLGIMGIVLGRQTVTPIRRLQTKARSMEAGDLEVDLESGRTDEIGRLYGAFDSMRISLREQIDDARKARDEADAERQRIQHINQELEKTADDYSIVMRRAAEGDLTARMDASTRNEAMVEIADEFNAMLAQIEQTVEQVNAFATAVATASEQVTASSEEVRTASEQVAESVQEISGGAKRQHEALGKVDSEMSNLSTTTQQIAASSNEVADIAERTAETGRKGRQAAQDAIQSMRETETEAGSALEEMHALEEEVAQIDELVEQIQEIAGQTNMLALNANIEASRSASNEDGGFGVVAQEVKELSTDAKQAADKIEQRLGSIREQTDDSATEVEATSQRLQNASSRVKEAVEALEVIAQYAAETNSGIQEISAATEQQAASTQEVVAMVDEAASVSEETTAEAESVASAAEEQTAALTEVSGSASDLSGQAAHLSEVLDEFDTDADSESSMETGTFDFVDLDSAPKAEDGYANDVHPD
ncbi:methyl-accepting chemotaxis protein [Natronosalvus amylolyticus]|uniref:methyl-accepting chemotaxis protein n=1 Tax=Natronosalvus amylolyticus TaxID=2961994 RepID=UPI0020CA163D|nr:methyl-accepting chemotaxis protein [Natronosalvus amylolyticus]